MTINISFDSFEEMIKYADGLKKGTLLGIAEADTGIDLSAAAQPEKTEATPPAGDMSIPYGRQIAPHFPNANVSQQPQPVQSVAQQPAVPTAPPAVSAAVSQQAAPAATNTQPSIPSAVPTTPHEYNQDDLARAAMQLMDKGGMQQLQQLLAGYGCETLQQLPKEQYGNFATALRGMGAQI